MNSIVSVVPVPRTCSLHAMLASRRRPPSLLKRLAPALLALFAMLASLDVAAQEWRYRVRPGDNVWDLARAHMRPDVPWQQLQALNGVDDPYRLEPGSVMRFPLAWLRVQPAKARVVAVSGSISVYADEASGVAVPATVDQMLGAGTMLRTASDASLTLEFADGSRLQLLADSELHLDRLSAWGRTGMVDTRLRLPRGRTSHDVKPGRGPGSHFSVESPGLMTSVRGTGFRVASDGEASRSEVYRGRVDVEGGGRRVQVGAGLGTHGDAGQGPITPVPLLPAPDLVRLPDTVQWIPAELAWAPLPGARGYRLQASSHDDFRTLLQDVRVDAAAARLDVQAAGTVHVRVRGIDERGLEGLDAVRVLQIAAQPGPPFTVSPGVDSEVAGPRPRLRWTASEGAASYRVQVARTADFSDLLVDREEVTAVELRTPVELEPDTYYWRIGAVDATGRRGPFGDPVPFAVRAADAPPMPTADRDGKILQVGWQSAGEGQRYRFQLSRKADFSTLAEEHLVDENLIALPDIGTGTWHMRVQVVESDGYAHPVGPTQALKVGCGACRVLLGIAAAVLIVL
ncbi:FecR domain-containing protein [Luteimonas sp. A501]